MLGELEDTRLLSEVKGERADNLVRILQFDCESQHVAIDTAGEAGRVIVIIVLTNRTGPLARVRAGNIESARAVKRHGLVNDALRAIELDCGAVVTDDKLHLFAAPDP